MKIKIFAFAALLLLATLPAKATDQLPAEVHGRWCEAKKVSPTEIIYRRAANCPREKSADGFNDSGRVRCAVTSAQLPTVTSQCVVLIAEGAWVVGDKVLSAAFRRHDTVLARQTP